VKIAIQAFGLNRAEMFTRQGHSPSVQFPRVIGIECVGLAVEAPGTNLQAGQKVVAIMGGMGRDFDGSYAEFTSVPAASVFPVETDLEWFVLGALPEIFQTTWGSLKDGLDVQAGQTLLIRGGTSSIGMMATRLAKSHGLHVCATTRNPAKEQALRDNGVDEVFIDDGHIAATVRRQFPQGVDCVLELVGTTTLKDSLHTCRAKGVVCMTGILGNSWEFERFAPMDEIPHAVRLTVYSGGAEDLDIEALQQFLGELERGEAEVNIDRVFAFDELVEAHEYMESNRAKGKLVVRQ
tara:strand:+ start:506 stop:1387 length:882 start_codon:yes stop_codon:yes gene_type:complete